MKADKSAGIVHYVRGSPAQIRFNLDKNNNDDKRFGYIARHVMTVDRDRMINPNKC